MRIFDTDQHVTPPKDLWTSRMPRKYQDDAPRVIDLDDGGQAWSFDGGAIQHLFGMENVGSGDPRTLGYRARYDDLDPAYYEPKARIEAMDIDGITATLLFPSVAGKTAGIVDDNLWETCLKVYNDGIWDWVQEGDPTRLFPTALIPNRGIETAMDELSRVAEKGFRHFQFILSPSGNTYPTAEDEPFWALVEETGLVMSMHGGGPPGRKRRPIGEPLPPRKMGKPEPPVAHKETIAAIRAGGLGAPQALALLVTTGVLERYPGLKIALIETSVGWFPSFADQLNAAYARHGSIVGQLLSKPPSEYLKMVRLSIDREIHGVKHRDQFGADQLLFGTDYPHVGNYWPYTRYYIDLLFQDADADEVDCILWRNTASLFGVN
jgi:predicted TIM-barrel fold metal-dependent hydrolase